MYIFVFIYKYTLHIYIYTDNFTYIYIYTDNFKYIYIYTCVCLTCVHIRTRGDTSIASIAQSPNIHGTETETLSFNLDMPFLHQSFGKYIQLWYTHQCHISVTYIYIYMYIYWAVFGIFHTYIIYNWGFHAVITLLWFPGSPKKKTQSLEIPFK